MTVIPTPLLDQAYRARRVLVTGATGFVGRHLLHALEAVGAQLALIVRKEDAQLSEHACFIGDLRQRDFVSAAVSSWRPEIVFHLAASRARSLAPADFATAIDVNLTGSLHLLEALAQAGCARRIVLLGTAEEYGRGPVPFREDGRESPVSAYSLSKLSATHLAQMMSHTLGLPATVLRPSVAYGPQQHEDMFLPAVIQALLKRQDFPMTAGEQTRDFIFVQDLVQAIGLAGMASGTDGEVINIGSGQAIHIRELVHLVEGLTGAPGFAKRGAIAYRPGEAMNYQLDIGKAERLLGWKPQTALEEGLERTVAWYMNR